MPQCIFMAWNKFAQHGIPSCFGSWGHSNGFSHMTWMQHHPPFLPLSFSLGSRPCFGWSRASAQLSWHNELPAGAWPAMGPWSSPSLTLLHSLSAVFFLFKCLSFNFFQGKKMLFHQNFIHVRVWKGSDIAFMSWESKTLHRNSRMIIKIQHINNISANLKVHWTNTHSYTPRGNTKTIQWLLKIKGWVPDGSDPLCDCQGSCQRHSIQRINPLPPFSPLFFPLYIFYMQGK